MTSRKNKHIILITIDCLRADHLHCMGYQKPITPTIDQFAQNGVLFTNAYANGPFTPYSIPSFLTSNLPPITGNLPTIAQVLREQGYSTAAFIPNPMVLSESCGGARVDKGFDVFDMMLTYQGRYHLVVEMVRMMIMNYIRRGFNTSGWWYQKAYKLYDKAIQLFPVILCPKNHLHIPIAEAINQSAIKWIKNQEKKFFLWLHYMDVHEPYAPLDYENQREMLYLITKYRDFPDMLTKEEIQKILHLYDQEIAYTDKAIGNFTEELKTLNCFDNTIFILSADHGDAFAEHGLLGHGGKILGQLLYDELLHIPLIIFGLEEKGIVIDKQVQLLDLAPTICDIINIPKSPTFLGENLLRPSKKGMIALTGRFIAYRTKEYKLIIAKREGERNLLFDLQKDPEERINIYNRDKRQTEEIESEMTSVLSEYKKQKKVLDVKAKIE